jgi:DNA invertase Pin-like site-specific DNA recombinase
LQHILHEVQRQGCGFVSLGESRCDTTSEVGRLMLTIMGGIAEFECGLIRKRCEDGIERAKANGKQFGRLTALDAGQRRRVGRAVRCRRDNGTSGACV